MEKSNNLGWGQCHLSTIPIRGEAKHSSEMVSQLLFQEKYKLLQQESDWYYIRCQHDDYQGWIPTSQYHAITPQVYQDQYQYRQQAFLIFHKNKSLLTFLGSPMYEPYPEMLPPIEYNSTAVIELAKKYINTPYLWGGRSPLGIDCSGLMQVVFGALGYSLPRDAYQQVEIGKKIHWGEHQAGDVAFFENAQGKITHVGLLTKKDEIIHASAWVRQDKLTKEGIFHQSKKTHQLSQIKRFEHI